MPNTPMRKSREIIGYARDALVAVVIVAAELIVGLKSAARRLIQVYA
jgi:hypothetical protein